MAYHSVSTTTFLVDSVKSDGVGLILGFTKRRPLPTGIQHFAELDNQISYNGTVKRIDIDTRN
jgi:hypothetical protein